ncbi:hypothetical protein RB4149 [Rhodopirellula baltica SH 1]|uniref:Uncharacterized protein n=1 Tax=Rhodopirellula baltica (strain DSM 10527 / NCIMB 13988 / SH1) TaxID=243090 RepID=Q7UT30_RHOBA|nr:hypothetical protein RB4149 [Rhodopirellula baltica SH 1]
MRVEQLSSTVPSCCPQRPSLIATGATSHARPSPSRTPERRRSTSPQTLFRER